MPRPLTWEKMMKLTKEHFDHIRNAIKPRAHLAPQHRAYLASRPEVKDLDVRVRWDFLHAAGLTPWICACVYPYANDTHIDTALRRIQRELNL